MASTSVVDLTYAVTLRVNPDGSWGVAAPQRDNPEGLDYGSMSLIDEIYIELAKEGITRENISILTNNSPALTDANKREFMERNGDDFKARERLIKINVLIETLVIDGYGENGLNVHINSIIAYIYFRLYREEGITMLDIQGLTGGNPYLTPEAEDDIIYMYARLGVLNALNELIISLEYCMNTVHPIY